MADRWGRAPWGEALHKKREQQKALREPRHHRRAGRRLLPDLQSGPGGLAAGRINAEPAGWEGSEVVGSGRRRR